MLRSTALFLACVVCGAGFAQSDRRVERPEIRVGDAWKYRVTDRYTGLAHAVWVEVTSVTPDRIHTRSTRSSLGAGPAASESGSLDVWDRDWNPIAQGTIEYKPPYPTLQFPLEPGKQWRGRAQWRVTNGSGIMQHDVTARVAGWERVAVPAGTFEAMRVTRRGDFVESQTLNYYSAMGNISDEIWYAPALGQIVRKEILHRDFSNIRTAQLSELWELLEFQRK